MVADRIVKKLSLVSLYFQIVIEKYTSCNCPQIEYLYEIYLCIWVQTEPDFTKIIVCLS